MNEEEEKNLRREPIRTEDDILSFLERHSRPRKEWLVGMEYERLGVFCKSGKAISYYTGVEPLLEELARRDGWKCHREDGHVISLSKDGDAITLEPGGQIEHSTKPMRSIRELRGLVGSLGELLDEIAAERGIVLLGIGYQPFSKLEEVEWIPKKRYQFMAPYLGRRGDLSHRMMKMTAGCQVALDYSDLTDAMRKMCAAARLVPLAQALFASSGIAEGRVLDDLCYRGRVWTRTDPQRTGIPPFLLRSHCDPGEYARYIMTRPLMFVERGGVYRDPEGKTFGDLMDSGAADEYDLEVALTQVFPEVRIKTFVEVRALDAPQPELITTAACFWADLLYGDLDAILDLTEELVASGEQEFAALRERVFREGLGAEFRGRPIAKFLEEILEMGTGETTCRKSFDLLRERLASGRTAAEGARELLSGVDSPSDFVVRWNHYRWW